MTGTGSGTTATYSFWIKGGVFNDEDIISNHASSTYRLRIGIGSDNKLFLYGLLNGSVNFHLTPSRVLRDTSAWYHIVVSIDTSQATSSDRANIYINGEQITDWDNETYPAQNAGVYLLTEDNLNIGRGFTTAYGRYFNGLMAHFHVIDGTAYDADTFGETDSTTGIWKPKTAPSVTYGTNGFFLKFENSGAMGTDSSGNSNTFTVNGTMTQTIDTPSNVFATANAIMGNLTATFSNGNLTVATTSSQKFGGASTLGVSSGKYYAEFKVTAQSAACGHIGIDGDPQESARNDNYAGQNAWSYGYNANGNKFNNNSGASYGDTFTLNDILMIAMDLDNNYVYFGKNGTWQNSGDPTSGATGTGAAYSISSSPPSGAYFFVTGDGSGSNSATIAHNYGNGFFGTTAVSSAQNPDDGIGIFEYDVPTGYRALCTKSINAEEYS